MVDATSTLRSDFEKYKTQVEICAWFGVAVIVCLICALIYAFYLIRKIRKETEELKELKEKLKKPAPARKFTIDRPRLLPWYDPLSKFQYDAALKSRVNYNGVQRTRSQPSVPSLPNYENINSPAPSNMFRNNNSSFLNRNRDLFNPKNGGPQLSPRTPSTPGNGNKERHFF